MREFVENKNSFFLQITKGSRENRCPGERRRVRAGMAGKTIDLPGPVRADSFAVAATVPPGSAALRTRLKPVFSGGDAFLCRQLECFRLPPKAGWRAVMFRKYGDKYDLPAVLGPAAGMRARPAKGAAGAAGNRAERVARFGRPGGQYGARKTTPSRHPEAIQRAVTDRWFGTSPCVRSA